MRFYTTDECEAWLTGRKRSKPEAVEGCPHSRIPYPRKSYGMFYIAHWIATHLTFRMPVLLWVTEWGIWPSSENWHLYYRLRHSHGDHRLLHEAPGHLFLEYEAEDLTSFLQLSMLNGWGGYVLPHANYANMFFSHDEYMDFYSKSMIPEIGEALGRNKAPTEPSGRGG
jgi:hypothetical protein